MALPDTTTAPPEKPPPSDSTKFEKREKPPTKVIIRRLPPAMTQDEFLSQVSPIPDYDYLYAVKGDMSLGENAFSRVYINFTKSDDIYMFKEKFDNYVFVDAKGHEYAAVVEFASFQKIPKKRGKSRPDSKIGTVETDPIYLEFLESLKQQPNQEEKPEFSYQPSSDSKNEISTPLLDYIKQRKIDRMKSREEKREERRKREMERKKVREEERRKRIEEKSPMKSVSLKTPAKSESTSLAEAVGDKPEGKPPEEEKIEKEKSDKPVDNKQPSGSSFQKGKEAKKFDDYKTNAKFTKTKFPRSEKYESYDKNYKSRRDEGFKERDRRGKFEDRRKEETKKEAELKQFPKKVKKYSERREERKFEMRKAEQKKEENRDVATPDSGKQDREEECSEGKKSESSVEKEESQSEERNKEELRRTSSREDEKSDDQDKSRNKENDPRLQRRIRNKDRPTMQLYQPGMLSKRRHQEDDKDPKESVKE